MLQLQTKVVCTLNVLCVELSEKLDLILATIQCNNLSPSLISPPNALLTPLTTQPAKINMDQWTHPSSMLTQLWLQCHTDPCNKLAPILKFTPYKKPIPAKPPLPTIIATWSSPKPRIVCIHPECNGLNIAITQTAQVWVFLAY